MTISSLPARYLHKRELAELVENLASHPDLWRGQVAYSGGRRQYASIHRDEYVDIWLICWSPGNDTGWHDHDISAGAVRVVGGSICFGPDHIHRLTCEAERSVSLHAYSPPLWRLGQYSIDDDGVMRRVSVSYADELRPLDAPSPAQVA